MLKAIVSYSKKIPVPDSEFSSQGYSLSLETEIPDIEPSAIQSRLHQTFNLVKATVEEELANGNGSGRNSDAKPQERRAQSRDTAEKASNKQVKFITDLAGQRGLSISDINADVRKRFGVDGIYDLTRKQASALLDELHGKKAA